MAQLHLIVLLCLVVIPYQTDCVDSQTFKAIPGGGDRRYIFSEEYGTPPLTLNDAVKRCQILPGATDLATAGHLPSGDADPVLKYLKDNNMENAWLGAYKHEGTRWQWLDGRVLSSDSNLWAQNPPWSQPSGDGCCIEFINDPGQLSGYINDLSCTTHKRQFVCEKDI